MKSSAVKKRKIPYSVVMATYNGSKYVLKQLKSIEIQTSEPAEIIIIDDASTDGTPSVLENYIKKMNISVKLFSHEINSGYRKTFFEAISLAKQNIIFLADQDDIWKPDKAEIMLDILQRNPFILVLNTNYDLIDSAGNRIKESRLCSRRGCFTETKSLKKVSGRQVVKYNLSMGCTMVIRKEVANIASNYSEYLSSMNIPHDWAINLIASLNDGLYYYNEKLISYRLHESNTLGLGRATDIKQRVEAYENMIRQRTDMEEIVRLIGYEDIYLANFIKNSINNYRLLSDALKTKSMNNYIRTVLNKKSYRYLSWKTIAYDGFLIIKTK